MVGKPNVIPNAATTERQLDSERAASMADEGGAAGAFIEGSRENSRERELRYAWIGAGALCVALTVLGWVAMRKAREAGRDGAWLSEGLS